jgi:FkbM family methyltransferase
MSAWVRVSLTVSGGLTALTNSMLCVLASLLHRLPIQSGLSALSFNPVVFRLMAGVPPVAPAKLRDGNWIDVTTSDYHGRVLYLFGTNDPKVERTSNALLKPNDVFLDIGANYSTIGLSASHVVGPDGAVHLFEPQRLLSDRVAKTIEQGRYRNVHLHRVGLLDRDARLTLKSPGHHSGMATFAHHDLSTKFQNVEECEVREISAYAGPLVKGRYFGAKLDIEGSEPAVMPWLLSQPNLVFLIFEAVHNQAQLYEEVRRAGLVLFGLKRHPLKLRVVRIDEFPQMAMYHDLVAIRLPAGTSAPKETHPQTLARKS